MKIKIEMSNLADETESVTIEAENLAELDLKWREAFSDLDEDLYFTPLQVLSHEEILKLIQNPNQEISVYHEFC